MVDVEFEIAAAHVIKPTINKERPAIDGSQNQQHTSELVELSQENQLRTEHQEQMFKPYDELYEVLKQQDSDILKIDPFYKQSSLVDPHARKLISFSIESITNSVKSEIKDGIYKYKLLQSSASEKSKKLLEANFDILINHARIDKTISSDEAVNYHNEIYSNLPILLSQPIIDQNGIKPDLASLLLSRTYSTNHEQTSQLIGNISAKLTSYNYKYDVMAFVTLGIAQGQDFPSAKYISHIPTEGGVFFAIERQDPLTIIHATNQDELKNYTYFSDNSDIGGFYRIEYNTLVFADERSFIHEAAHAVMNLAFNNNCKPYHESKGPIYDEYQQAEQELLLKIINRLGFESTQNLEEQSVDSLKSILKKETILDLLRYASDPLKIESDQYYLLSKYFPNREFEDFSQFFIEFASTKIAELKLTESEYSLIGEITTLLHSPAYYNQNTFDSEVIVRLPQLAFEGVDAATMHHYFGKMEQFWNNHVHSHIASLVEEHQDFCSIKSSCPIEHSFMGNSSNINFEHCVGELLA